MREIACFNSLRNLPKIALLSVYATAACEPNLKEFLHSFEKLHTVGVAVFGGCHPLEAQNFIHNYDIYENKQKFPSWVCVSLQIYDKRTVSPNFALLLRTSDRVIILAVISISLTLVRMRNMVVPIFFLLLCTMLFLTYYLYWMRISIVLPITNYFLAHAHQPIIFQIYLYSFCYFQHIKFKRFYWNAFIFISRKRNSITSA